VFNASNSRRWRTGGRLSFAAGEYIRPYVGAHYEYEFNGAARASINDEAIIAPTLKGGSGLGEIGMTIRQPKTGALALDFGGQGYFGVRKGIGGTFRFKYEF